MDTNSSILFAIVQSMHVRWRETEGAGSEAMDAEVTLRAQLIGFFTVLSEWLGGATRRLGGPLDALTDEGLLARAECGLAGFGPELGGFEPEADAHTVIARLKAEGRVLPAFEPSAEPAVLRKKSTD